MSFYGKTVFITGASRGIGKAIALKCAEQRANVGIIARSKTIPSHDNLTGTLDETARLIKLLGGNPFVMSCDLRCIEETQKEVKRGIEHFGGVDALVNNASAIYMSKVNSMNQYNTMMDINVRGTANMIATCFEELQKSDMRHVTSISPPIDSLNQKWIMRHPAYTLSKYGMTIMTLGYADVLKANTIWPKKLIKTAATKMLEEKTTVPAYSQGLKPDYFATSVVELMQSDFSGKSVCDDDIRKELGMYVEENGVDDIFI